MMATLVFNELITILDTPSITSLSTGLSKQNLRLKVNWISLGIFLCKLLLLLIWLLILTLVMLWILLWVLPCILFWNLCQVVISFRIGLAMIFFTKLIEISSFRTSSGLEKCGTDSQNNRTVILKLLQQPRAFTLNYNLQLSVLLTDLFFDFDFFSWHIKLLNKDKWQYIIISSLQKQPTEVFCKKRCF